MKLSIVLIAFSLIFGCTTQEKKAGVIPANVIYSDTVEYLIRFPAVFPEEAIERSLTGRVAVTFNVNNQGKAVNIKVKDSSNPVFNNAAFTCLKKSLFKLARSKSDREIIHRANFTFTEEDLLKERSLLGVKIVD